MLKSCFFKYTLKNSPVNRCQAWHATLSLLTSNGTGTFMKSVVSTGILAISADFFLLFKGLTGLKPESFKALSKTPRSKHETKKRDKASLKFSCASSLDFPCENTSRIGQLEIYHFSFFSILRGNVASNFAPIFRMFPYFLLR